MKKKLLSNLMGLDNPHTDAYLSRVAKEMVAKIKGSRDNDSIFEQLDLIDSFIYKAPEDAVKIVRFIVTKNPIIATTKKTPMGSIKGRSHKDLILKCVEMLSKIRYILPKDVLELISKISLYGDKTIHDEAIKVAERFAKYDYNILAKTKIGYGAQKTSFDYIVRWSVEKQLKYIDFFEAISGALLDSSVEGSEWTKEDTLKMHFGAVDPTDFLKKIRRDTIDIIFKLYKSVKDAKVRLRLVNILDQASRTPMNVNYGDSLINMIQDDLNYLMDIYDEIIFSKDGRMISDLGIVEEIEQRLYWINRGENKKNEKSLQLREKILKDEIYHIFRVLVGDPKTYREEESWDESEKRRNTEMEDIINAITEKNIHKWVEKLNIISSQMTVIDEWKFHPLKAFFKKLSGQKPLIADEILQIAFKEKLYIKQFMGSFLDGFRNGLRFDLWDKFVNKIIKTKDGKLLPQVIYSFNILEGENLAEKIREKDISILNDIVEKKGHFRFVASIKDDRVIHFALINALGRIYKINHSRIEDIIVKEIKNNPNYSQMYLLQLPHIIRIGWIECDKLKKSSINLLIKIIITLPDVNWEMQDLLAAIGKREGIMIILDVFLARIKKDEKRQGEKRWASEHHYEAIPYHFNPDLIELITSDQKYNKIVESWLSNMTLSWSIYNWDVSHFLQRMGKGFEDVLKSIIGKGGDQNLMRAAYAMQSIERANFDLCIEIVRRTENKKILEKVSANMYSTGVVSGEYGIAEAYENKIKLLEPYKNDESISVKKFVTKMIKNLTESAKRERQRSDEEKQLRKIEFEG